MIRAARRSAYTRTDGVGRRWYAAMSQGRTNKNPESTKKTATPLSSRVRALFPQPRS